jgi:large subunit ribosomal protein L10
VVKGGFIDGSVLSADEVKKVANLPPKAVLVAQIMGLVNAPLQGVVSTVHAVMTSLAVAADEIRKQKEGAA